MRILKLVATGYNKNKFFIPFIKCNFTKTYLQQKCVVNFILKFLRTRKVANDFSLILLNIINIHKIFFVFFYTIYSKIEQENKNKNAKIFAFIF